MMRNSAARTLLLIGALGVALPTVALAKSASNKVTRAKHDNEDSARDRPGYYTVNRKAKLYSAPSADSRILRELPPGTVVRVIHVRDQWYDVKSEHGNQDGYIRRSYADPPSSSGRHVGSDSGSGRSGPESRGGERLRFRKGAFRLVDPVVVRAEPDLDSRKVATLRAGTEVHVVDKQGNWYRIESESGNKPPGYIPTVSAKRVEGARN